MKVTVYCSSSNQIDSKYFELTNRIANVLLDSNAHVVFGGGANGLMGQLANTIVAKNGKITGIMPEFMKEVEWQHKGVKDFVFVESMRERKHLLMKGTDVLIALPGGCGTLEELLEAISLKRLGKYTGAIVIVNFADFYTPLIQMLEKCIDQKFLQKEHRKMWSVIKDADELLSAIEQAPKWDESAIKIALVNK